MYIWTGADVDGQLQELKQMTRAAEEKLSFEHSNFTLPFHISLKMSFPIPDEQKYAAIDCLTAFYSTLSPIAVPVRGIEKENGIVWLRMAECPELDGLHDRLNTLMQENFGVGLHPYDCDYLFHTTLFMDADNEKLAKAYELVRNAPVPSELCLNRFLIGGSPAGKLGTFQQYCAVDLNNRTTGEITLKPMTRELCHMLFNGWENDPVMYADPAGFVPYRYDPETVDRYFDSKQEPSRVVLAIMLGDQPIGEIHLKHIDPDVGACTMGIHLKNDLFKGRGYGTHAEHLALRYAFETLGLKTVYADALSGNVRSQHVLEKAGFRFLEEKNGFRYYRCDRNDCEES